MHYFQKLNPFLGWEKHSDENGFYYWHIKSGTIQRDEPQWNDDDIDKKSRTDVVRNVRSSNIFEDDFDPTLVATQSTPTQVITSMSKSCTASSIVDLSKEREMEHKRRSLPPSKADSLDDGSARPMRVSDKTKKGRISIQT